MTRTEDVYKHAAEQGIAEEGAAEGLEERGALFMSKGAEVYAGVGLRFPPPSGFTIIPLRNYDHPTTDTPRSL